MDSRAHPSVFSAPRCRPSPGLGILAGAWALQRFMNPKKQTEAARAARIQTSSLPNQRNSDEWINDAQILAARHPLLMAHEFCDETLVDFIDPMPQQNTLQHRNIRVPAAPRPAQGGVRSGRQTSGQECFVNRDFCTSCQDVSKESWDDPTDPNPRPAREFSSYSSSALGMWAVDRPGRKWLFPRVRHVACC